MKYIDAEKLKELIGEKWKELADKNVKAGGGKWDAEISTYLSVLRLIESLQQEQSNQEESIYVHKKYNREYRIVSNNARLKNSNGEWIDCVIYAPLYENEFEMFAREKESFYKEFEKK